MTMEERLKIHHAIELSNKLKEELWAKHCTVWVYTELGEMLGREYGFLDRICGTVAMCGNDPVDGLLAKAWEKMGLIRKEVRA